MTLATQPTAWPTNKLTIGGPVAAAVSAWWMEVMPSYSEVWSGPATALIVGAVAAYAVGYFIPDRANVPNTPSE